MKGRESKQYSIVMVGAGRMGKNHLRAMARSKIFNLVAVIDPEKPPLEAEMLQSAAYLRSLEELFAAPVVYDCALVAATTGVHFEIAQVFLKKRVHLLMEKPLASTCLQSEEIVRLAKSNNLVLATAHVERFNPAIRELQAVLEKHLIGEIVSLQSFRGGLAPQTIGHGNDVVLDMAVHDIDIISMLVGPLSLQNVKCRSIDSSGTFHHADIFFHGKNGVPAIVSASWLSPIRHRTLRITGTEGVALVDFLNRKTLVYKRKMSSGAQAISGEADCIEGKDVLRDSGLEPIQDALEAQLKDFEQLLLQSEGAMSLKFLRTICLGEEGAQAVRLVEEARMLGRKS